MCAVSLNIPVDSSQKNIYIPVDDELCSSVLFFELCSSVLYAILSFVGRTQTPISSLYRFGTPAVPPCPVEDNFSGE